MTDVNATSGIQTQAYATSAHPFSRAGASPGADSGCGHYYDDDDDYVYRSGPGSPPECPTPISPKFPLVEGG